MALASLPLRFWLINCFSEVALACIHILLTCFWGPTVESPAYPEWQRIMGTVCADLLAACMPFMFLDALIELSVDARCRNCVSALQYHRHSVHWVLSVVLPLCKSLVMHGEYPTHMTSDSSSMGRDACVCRDPKSVCGPIGAIPDGLIPLDRHPHT